VQSSTAGVMGHCSGTNNLGLSDRPGKKEGKEKREQDEKGKGGRGHRAIRNRRHLEVCGGGGGGKREGKNVFLYKQSVKGKPTV